MDVDEGRALFAGSDEKSVVPAKNRSAVSVINARCDTDDRTTGSPDGYRSRRSLTRVFGRSLVSVTLTRHSSQALRSVTRFRHPSLSLVSITNGWERASNVGDSLRIDLGREDRRLRQSLACGWIGSTTVGRRGEILDEAAGKHSDVVLDSHLRDGFERRPSETLWAGLAGLEREVSDRE